MFQWIILPILLILGVGFITYSVSREMEIKCPPGYVAVRGHGGVVCVQGFKP